VFAALAVSRFIEDRTGWSIRKFVRTTRRYRTIEIQADLHVITAADPIPEAAAKPSPRSTTPGLVRTSLVKVGLQPRLGAPQAADRRQDPHLHAPRVELPAG